VGKLDGKVAVVTGASSGIGEATAEALAGEGATVVVAARREERLSDLVGRIEGSGGRTLAVSCDVTDEGQAHALIQRRPRRVRVGRHTGQQRGRHAALEGREGPLGPVAPDVRRERVVLVGINISASASSWRRTAARRSNSRCRPSVGLSRFSERWGT